MPDLLRFVTRDQRGLVTRYVELDALSYQGWIWYAHTVGATHLLGRRCTLNPYQMTGRHDFAWSATRWLTAGGHLLPGWHAHVVCDDGEIVEAGHGDGLVSPPTVRATELSQRSNETVA